MQKSILIVEDDKSLSTVLDYNFKKNNFETRVANDGEQAMVLLKEKAPDVIILDWMMPEPNGLKICQMIRKNKVLKNLSIILLTAKGEEEDKIMGLNHGADDYMVKPFSPLELIARVNALIRRTNITYSDEELNFEDIKINLKEFKVFRANKQIHLGPTEFKMLNHFMQNPKRVFSREQLLNSIWGHGVFIEERTIDTHVRRLRKALNLDGKKDLIRTIRGAGYSFDTKDIV